MHFNYQSFRAHRMFIGSSDARIIMGHDEAALIRLWREKRGELAAQDFSGNLLVQLGKATEDLNRSWYERNTGRTVDRIQRVVRHSAISWMVAALDGVVAGLGAVFEPRFMLPWSFSEEAAVERHMAQVQHKMWVTHLTTAVLSIITGGGKWVEITIPMDPLYLSLLVSAEKRFWRCAQSGEVPHLTNLEPPRPRVEAIRIVDMSSSKSWAEIAATFCSTRAAYLEHERAKSGLMSLMPACAKEAIGHGVHARRLKPGAVSFDVVDTQAAPATLHVPVAHSAGAGVDCPELDADPNQRGIDKSVLTLSTPRRYRNKEHLRFVARQPCLLCGRKPSDPHHLGFLQPRALGRKASDEFAVPLCRTHHRAAHGAGDERAWWKSAAIDPEKVARKLWKATRMGEGDLSPERSVDARVPPLSSTPVADPKLPARKPEPQRPDQDGNTGHVRGPRPDFTALADLVEMDPSAAPKIVPDHPGKQDEHEQNSGN